MTIKALLWAILIVFVVLLLVHIPFLFYTRKPQHPIIVVKKEYPSAYRQIAYPNYWEWPTLDANSQRPITSSERYWEWPSGWYGSPWYYGGGGGTYSGGIRTHGGHGGGGHGGYHR